MKSKDPADRLYHEAFAIFDEFNNRRPPWRLIVFAVGIAIGFGLGMISGHS